MCSWTLARDDPPTTGHQTLKMLHERSCTLLHRPTTATTEASPSHRNPPVCAA